MSLKGARVTKTIVLVHGANCGGWCFDVFRKVFEARGFTCHAPDLIGHGADKADGIKKLTGVGMADYRAQMTAYVEALPEKPILLGHSMGAVIAQQLAASSLAEKLVLVSPAPHAGILPSTDPENQLCQDLMSLGPFWTWAFDPNFDIACKLTLNRLSKDEQRRVFAQFGPEFGQGLVRDFFLDVRRDGRDRRGSRGRILSGADTDRGRGSDRRAGNSEGDSGVLSRQPVLGARRSSTYAACGGRRGRDRGPHRRLAGLAFGGRHLVMRVEHALDGCE